MGETKKKLVKCLVCGAVFEEGTEVCPVCGVGPENFVPYEEEEKSFHRDTEEIFLILGNGAAGLNAAEAIRERNSTCSIVMVTNEDSLTYSRPMLTKALLEADNGEQSSLLVHDASWYEEKRILNLTEKKAEKIDPAAKEVTFSDGIRLKYDKCIYALGSECFVPPIPGHDKPQVIAIRRLSDTEKIRELLPQTSHKADDPNACPAKSAVVIGGGVLGLEAAWELKKAGLDVTVLELAPQLMGRQLDAGAGEFLKNLILNTGISIHLNVKIDAIEGGDSVTGVRLGDGTVIPAQLVIVSAGVRASVSLAQEAGASIGRAVKVNQYMETSVQDIYACGDCAEYEGINYAIWPQAVEMGKAAGANAAGDAVSYHTVLAALTFNGMNTSLFAVGDTGKNPEKEYTVKHEEDAGKAVYKTWYYADGKLTGAILIGDTKEMQSITEEME